MSDPFLPEIPAEAAEVREPVPLDETIQALPEVDLQALAREVYVLLKEDLRRECERLGRP